jgi:hypothetical protein
MPINVLCIAFTCQLAAIVIAFQYLNGNKPLLAHI